MTAELADPTPAPSPAEVATIARFGIFEAEERVEQVARAITSHTEMLALSYNAACSCGWKGDRFVHHAARAAIAAQAANPAEEAVRRVEALADELDRQAGTYLNADLRRRAYADAAHLVRRALDGA